MKNTIIKTVFLKKKKKRISATNSILTKEGSII